jgi:hypothetical protein
LRTRRLGKYFSASALSVALTVASISAPVMLSIVVGICVGSELMRAPVMVMMPALRILKNLFQEKG